MEPKDYFKKKIIGRLVTRKIDKLSLEGVPSSIKSEKIYNIIDIVIQGDEKLFVTNNWNDESTKEVLAIHNNFVKEHNCDESTRDKFIEQGFRPIGRIDVIKKPDLSKVSESRDSGD